MIIMAVCRGWCVVLRRGASLFFLLPCSCCSWLVCSWCALLLWLLLLDDGDDDDNDDDNDDNDDDNDDVSA